MEYNVGNNVILAEVIMFRKIGKNIMVTAIVLLIIGVVGALLYNTVSCMTEWKELKKLWDEGFFASAKEFNTSLEKIIIHYVVRAVICIVVCYVMCIVLCGYGRIIQDNSEKTQATKELNSILKKHLNEKSNHYDFTLEHGEESDE